MSERNSNRGSFTSATSRRVYLMRRAAGGLVLIGLVHLIFARGKDASLLFDLICFAAAVLLWIIAERVNRSRSKVDPRALDENGNARKKIM